MTVLMLARIDGTQQATQQEVEDKLRKSAANLSNKIALGNMENSALKRI